jgi:hypothetical protein
LAQGIEKVAGVGDETLSLARAELGVLGELLREILPTLAIA